MLQTQVRLSDVLSIQNGFAFDSNQFGPNGKPLIRIRDLRNGRSTETRYAGEYDPRYLVKRGDLLIGMDGEFRCYEWQGDEALLNQRVCRLEKFDHEVVFPAFLRYVLDAHLKEIEDRTGFTTVKHLSAKTVLDLRVALPPLDEQKRIVAKLDAAMLASKKLLDNLNTQDNLVRTLTSSVAASAVSELTGPTVPLVEIASVEYGTRLTRKSDGGTKYPVYGGGGETFRTDSWNREDCYIVSRFAMSEECVRFVGGRFFLNDSGLSVATSDEAVLQQDFLNAYLLARSAEIYALGRGTAQRNLDVPAFKAMPIPVPPRDEQRRFVEKIEGLRRQGKRLTALREEKRSSLVELNRAIVNSLLQEES